MAKSFYKIKEDAELWLKDKLDEDRIVFKKSELNKSIYRYLESNSFLVDFYSSYFFIKTDDVSPLEAFKLQYWKILVQFLKLRFPSTDGNPAWYLTGKYAYELMIGKVLVPELNEQITIQTQARSNTTISIMNDHKIIASMDKNIDHKTIVKIDVDGEKLFILKPEYMIVHSDPTQYRLYEENIVSVMKTQDFDYDYLLEYFKRNQAPIYHARFIGALKQVNENIKALKFEELFKQYNYKVAIENPFSREYHLKKSSKPSYATRFGLSMDKAIKYLNGLELPRRLNKKLDKSDIDNLSVNDAYHSLTIEGYDVTQEIIHKLKNGDEVDSDLKNKTAAKGFIKVVNFIKSLLETEYEINRDLTEELWKELWSPSINAELFDFEIDIYRKRPVFIRDSLSVPPAHEKIYDLLEEFYARVNNIENGIAQGIFAHFFYIWIHPHTDGNGRISRFLMNLAFIKDKYRWLTIKIEQRNDYFKVLERSQLEDDISYFADFIVSNY